MTAYLYPAERARLLREHADAFEAICVRLTRQAPGGDTLANPHATTGHFVNALLASAVRADGQTTAPELAIVAEYFRDGWELRDDDAWVQDSRKWQSQLDAIRPFLLAAQALDARSGSELRKTMELLITDMAALVVTSDGHTSAGEGSFVADLLTRLAS